MSVMNQQKTLPGQMADASCPYRDVDGILGYHCLLGGIWCKKKDLPCKSENRNECAAEYSRRQSGGATHSRRGRTSSEIVR